MLDYVDEFVPRSLKQLQDWLNEHYGISVKTGVLGRILRQSDYVYKRMRISMKQQRDQELFEFFKKEIDLLHQDEAKGLLDVYYFDETGINLSPVVPYGWQKKGETHQLSSLPSKNHTIVGFMNKACDFYGFRFEGAANAQTTIKCMDIFAEQINKKTVVIIDNASIHKAQLVMEKAKLWKQKGLYLQFIPAYSPELNLIERLWLEVKYRWVNKPGYFDDVYELEKQIDDVIRNIGTKYTVNFN